MTLKLMRMLNVILFKHIAESCSDIAVSIVSTGRVPERQTSQAISTSKGWTFKFKDIMPGNYKVTITKDEWCWQDKTMTFVVSDKDVTSLTFKQTGYLMSCSLSHDITLVCNGRFVTSTDVKLYR